ncbi:UDP-glucosyltransferase 2-like [Anticarsia gemmatalis]|uniref:UDP-glucosyltransferase 2-like n=1 Tax=Anticarsia gemmatalis TaxID=129554 RepID=UPI003F777C4C
MLRIALVILFCVQSSIVIVESARILGVFPIPSISHQVVFRALTQELAKRGHELVIITPDPALPKERPPDNITEIDTSQGYQLLAQFYKDGVMDLKRGVVTDLDLVLSGHTEKAMCELMSYQFDIPEVLELLKDKSQKFDLIFVEGFGNFHLIVTEIFKAPAIYFSSFFGMPDHYYEMGSMTWHPLLFPHFYRQRYTNLSFWEKLQQIYIEFKALRLSEKGEEIENKKLKQKFGPNTPDVATLRKNVQMLFVNSYPFFTNNRPVPPNIVYMGGLHLKPVKELPKDLKEYLDNSARGVVYISFGTNVLPTRMDKDLLDELLKGFGELPYDVLWKFNGDSIEVPSNVQTRKWFPQRDLLMHPKIKAFVMQGGLQSTDEAIEAGVPLVGMPMLGDQWYNVNKYVELGIGEHIDVLTVTSKDIVEKVTKVINDESYRKNIKKLHELIKDQPQTSLERAVWWTEHVLRHGSALHLQPPTAHITLREYLLLDVILPLIAIVAASLVLLLFACFQIRKCFISDVKLKRS